jgi:outer membrane lipoprotein
MKLVIVLFGIALFLQGCTYAISPALAHRADTTISFKKLLDDPESASGKLLILGGTLVQTTTLKEGTLLEIAQKALDYWGKPVRTKRTGGTFFILYPGYLNTMVYVPGVDITIAGEVLGHTSTILGDQQYDHPVLLSKELKLWERERPSWDKPRWMDPLYDPNSPATRE